MQLKPVLAMYFVVVVVVVVFMERAKLSVTLAALNAKCEGRYSVPREF